MSPIELLVLSLGVSVLTTVIGRVVGAVMDRRIGEARFRETVWAGALFIPLLPPLAVGLILLAPAPRDEAVVMGAAPLVPHVMTFGPPPPAEAVAPQGFRIDPAVGAQIVLGVAGIAMLLRGAWLIGRGRRLNRLLREAEPASGRIVTTVMTEAGLLGVSAPETRVGDTGGDVLLAGFRRPVLILPRDVRTDAAFAPVVRHELAHLKRGDHRAIWLEELALLLLAFNPMAEGVRARRSAAREEACDALALTGADIIERRAYAARLVETLKSGANAPLPALAFGGRRTFKSGAVKMKTPTMRRLGAILSPPRPAGRAGRAIAAGAGLAMLVIAGLASAAVALQREAVPTLVLNEEAAPDWLRDWSWGEAALAPVYRSVWPNACGVSRNEGGVVIHLGEGCAGADIPDARLTRLAGMDPARDPRGAFLAVKVACEAGRSVQLSWTEAGAARSTAVVCSVPPVAPVAPKAVEIALSFDGVDEVRPGDRLEVVLERVAGDARYAKSMMFDLGATGALPTEVRGQASQDLFADGQAPRLMARLIGADGVTRARNVARPRPMIVSADRAIAFADLTAVRAVSPSQTDAHDAASGSVRQALAAATPGLTPAQRTRFERATGEDYKSMCLSDDPLEDGFCAGVMFAALDMQGSSVPVCVRPDANGEVNAITAAARGKALMSMVPVQPGMRPRDVARVALATAWPCHGAERTATEGAIMVPVRLGVEGLPALTRGETLTVTLWIGEARGDGLTLLATRQLRPDTSGRLPGMVAIPLGQDLFPRFGQPARAYHISAEIQAANGDSIYGVAPTTLRLAAMGQGAARRLRPELTFRRSGVIGGPDPYPWAT